MHPYVRKTLLSKFQFEGSVEVDGQYIACIHPIEWYGNDNAFEIDVHRKRLGKISAFKELHNYLIEMTQSGTIGRQEAVSMLINQTGRLRSNNIVVTNHLGQHFPSFAVDRVLCDVPCSGDGTLVFMCLYVNIIA